MDWNGGGVHVVVLASGGLVQRWVASSNGSSSKELLFSRTDLQITL